MAVTKSIHAVVAPWGVAQVADAFKDAFIAAGLMTDWYDSFSSGGYEHRILEVTYDNTKNYGKCYYWFILNGVGVTIKTVTGWDAANNIPKGPTGAGAQRYDWPEDVSAASSVNNSSSWTSLLTLSNSINCSVTRYTSGDRSFFVLRSATSWATFTIDPPSTTFRSWYSDALIGGYHTGIWGVGSNGSRATTFFTYNRTSRALFGGCGTDIANGSTNRIMGMSSWGFQDMIDYGGNRKYGTFDGETNNIPHWYGVSMNSGVLSDFLPVFNGIRPSVIYAADLPNDFGVGALRYAAANSVTIQDTMVVSAGVEEYEVLSFRNRGTDGQVNPLFLARTVG